MRLDQRMKLAPRMIQSMEILQMPLQELEERIEQELEGNVTLELAEPGSSSSSDDGAEMGGGFGGEWDEGGSSSAEEGSLRVGEDSAADDFARLDAFSEFSPESAENAFDTDGGSDDGIGGLSGSNNSAWEGNAELAGLSESGRLSSRLDGERDAKHDALSNTAARSASINEQLAEQWALCDVDGSLRPLGDLLISFIDDDGYLRTPLETIADRAPAESNGGGGGGGGVGVGGPVGVADLERALTAVQLLLEPAGVAARDVRECLLLQLDALELDRASRRSRARRDDEPAGGVGGTGGAGTGAPDSDAQSAESQHASTEDEKTAAEEQAWADARAIVEHHLDDLGQNRLPRIADRLKIDVDRVKSAIERLRRLSLAPGRRLVDDPPSTIVPDAIVEYDPEHDRYFAYLNDARVPNVRINREYAQMSRDRSMPTETRRFLKKSLGNATWLVDAIEQRKRTILRVLEAVVEAQREYFDFGPQSLKPLPMTQVADQLGVHVATVSRAVAEKYVQTPRGIVPLRGFFSGGTQTESGEDVSWDAVKAALQEVIESEDRSSPMSDDALAAALKDRGIEIARRTVAKYRGQLGIPSARLRKAF